VGVEACDNFLYGFKGTAYRPRRLRRNVAEVGKSRGGMPVRARASWGDVWPAEGEGTCRQGEAVPWGSLGFARRLPRGGAPARAAPPPGTRPRTGPHVVARCNDRASWRAREPSGHEHQDDDAKPRLTPKKIKVLAPAWSGEKCAPRTTSEE